MHHEMNNRSKQSQLGFMKGRKVNFNLSTAHP